MFCLPKSTWFSLEWFFLLEVFSAYQSSHVALVRWLTILIWAWSPWFIFFLCIQHITHPFMRVPVGCKASFEVPGCVGVTYIDICMHFADSYKNILEHQGSEHIFVNLKTLCLFEHVQSLMHSIFYCLNSIM